MKSTLKDSTDFTAQSKANAFWPACPFKCARKTTQQQQVCSSAVRDLISSFAANQQGS